MNGAFVPNSVLLASSSFMTPMRSPFTRGALSRLGRRGPKTTRAAATVARSGALPPLRERHDPAARCPRVQLARAAHLGLGLRDHLIALRDPADAARKREDRREELDRYAAR